MLEWINNNAWCYISPIFAGILLLSMCIGVFVGVCAVIMKILEGIHWVWTRLVDKFPVIGRIATRINHAGEEVIPIVLAILILGTLIYSFGILLLDHVPSSCWYGKAR